VQARVRVPGGGSLVSGARLDHWSLTGHTGASPWLATSWPLAPSLTLRAGGGLYRQEPGFLETRGLHGTASLDGQRAWDADAGLEGRIGSSSSGSSGSRWQVTLYDREDRGVFRLPNVEGRVINGVYVPGSLTTRYVNALDGHARGVEALVQHRAPNGLSGWAAYSYGVNRYTDRATDESFWGDFDQRHAVNVYGTYRFSDRVSASARFRAGSNFPATGYYREQDGVDYATSARNELRVPYYARLDARLNRTFTWERKRLTLFLEGLNVLDRENVRVGIPSVNRRTLVATNLFDTMVPIVPSIGLLLEF
jgi:outer membrane receptor for ferrienterochelin and colicin